MGQTLSQKIIHKIGIGLTIIVMIMLNLIIGSNQNELKILPISITMFLIVIFLIIKKIFFKEKIVIKNRIDLIVLLFMCSTFLPYIFKTYCSLQGTVEFTLKYFFVYSIYLLVRNTVKSRKDVAILVNVTIIASLIPIVLGIDAQNKQYLGQIIKILKLNNPPKYRFQSIFGYSNTVSIYTTFCIFLSLNRIRNMKHWIIKTLYILYIVLGTYIIYISLSRAVFVLYIIGLLIYLSVRIFIKNKENKKGLITIISVIIAVIGIGIILITQVGLKYSKPYILNNTNSEIELKYKFESNKNYIMEFDLEAEGNRNANISIVERNIYYVDKTLETIQINDKDKKVKLEITPTGEILFLKIKINSTMGNLKINKLYINGKEYIINYKYLPYVVSRMITSFYVKDDSVVQRQQFYENSLRITKQSPIIGHGGNAWKKISRTTQEYPYHVKETHSYFFELLISYGIVGTALFLTVIIMLYFNIFKTLKGNQQKEKFLIAYGFAILLMHTICFDLNMSFLVILATVFEYIAILSYEDKKEFKISKYLDYAVITVLVLVLSVYVKADIAKYILKNNEEKSEMYPYSTKYKYDSIIMLENKDINKVKRLIQQEPYYNQNLLYMEYWNIIYKNVDKFSEKELQEHVDFGIKTFKNIKPVSPMYIDTAMERVEMMQNIVIELGEISKETNNSVVDTTIQELKEIMKQEYYINMINIQDTERNHLNEQQKLSIIERYNRIMQNIE